MIFFPTSRCNDKCKHCMSSCTNKGIDCTKDTFLSTLTFMDKVDPSSIVISGGEPTIHSNIMYYTGKLIKDFPRTKIVLLSNGSFIHNGEMYEELIDYVLASKLSITVTMDKKYYSTKFTLSEIERLRKHCNIVDQIPPRDILHIGRAALKKSKVRDKNKSNMPMCFNMRSLIRSGLDFKTAIHYLEARGKIMTPAILPTGNIILSQSMECTPIGNVQDSFFKLEKNIKNFDCVTCREAQRCITNPKYKSCII